MHNLDPVAAVREMPPDQAGKPVWGKKRHGKVAGPRVAEPDRVVTFGFTGVRNDESDGISDRRSLRRATALYVQVLVETVTPALAEEPDLRHKR